MKSRLCFVLCFLVGCSSGSSKEELEERCAYLNRVRATLVTELDDRICAQGRVEYENRVLKKLLGCNNLVMMIGLDKIDAKGHKDIDLIGSDGCHARMMWMEAGKKIILFSWFTRGKEAQEIKGEKNLQEAWEKHTPGVYKMVFDKDRLKELFPGKVFDIGEKGG